MSNQAVLRSLENLRLNVQEFQGNMSDLRNEMLAMNARMKTFDRKSSEVNKGLETLRQKQKDLAEIMERAEKLTR